MRCPDASDLASFAAHTARPSRIDLLESHVADCTDCRQLVFALALPEDSPADRIGRFVLEETIGTGAMGVVYRAHDPELDRKVAIKVHAYRSALAVANDERLRREAQALARLNHPHVVAVYEAGSHEDTTYVAMELVDGCTLAEWLEEAHAFGEIVDVFAQVARGLSAAHGAGLVHRDIKPRNVFVSASGTAKVGDFGLVRAEATAHGGVPADLSISLSGSHALVGTPAYMAPEQLRGEAATAASDQFSFCVMLHEAIYGVRPYVGETVGELAAVMARGLCPLPARIASPHDRVWRVPRRVRSVLERGLSVDPARRFASIDALLAALVPRARTWLPAAGIAVVAAAALAVLALSRAESPVAACEIETPTAARVFGADRIGLVAFGIATSDPAARGFADIAARDLSHYADGWRATSSAVCLATASGQQRTELGERQRACLERRALAADQLMTDLVRVDGDAIARTVDAIAGLEPVEVCAQPQLEAQEPPLAEHILWVEALQRQLDHVNAARILGKNDLRPAMERVLGEARRMRYNPLLARSLFIAADFAETADARAVMLREAAVAAGKARDDRLLALILIDLAYTVAIDQARPADGHDLLLAAEATLARAGDDRAVRWTLATNQAGIYELQGRTGDAVSTLRDLLTDTRGIAITHVAGAHNNLAGYLNAIGELDEAEVNFQAALEIFRQLAGGGDQHPSAVMVLINLAMQENDRENYTASSAYLERARAAAKIVLPPGHDYIGAIQDMLGSNATARDRYVEAVEHHRRAYEHFRSTRGAEHLRTGMALGNLGNVESYMKDHRNAIAHLAESVQIIARATTPTHRTTLQTRINYGKALGVAGDRTAARRELEAGIAGLPADDPFATMARESLASLDLTRSPHRD